MIGGRGRVGALGFYPPASHDGGRRGHLQSSGRDGERLLARFGQWLLSKTAMELTGYRGQVVCQVNRYYKDRGERSTIAKSGVRSVSESSPK